MAMKTYSVSKSGGTPAVLNALIKCGIFTRKFNSCEPGVITLSLSESEVTKLENTGCVIHEIMDNQKNNHTRLQLIPVPINFE